MELRQIKRDGAHVDLREPGRLVVHRDVFETVDRRWRLEQFIEHGLAGRVRAGRGLHDLRLRDQVDSRVAHVPLAHGIDTLPSARACYALCIQRNASGSGPPLQPSSSASGRAAAPGTPVSWRTLVPLGRAPAASGGLGSTATATSSGGRRSTCTLSQRIGAVTFQLVDASNAAIAALLAASADCSFCNSVGGGGGRLTPLRSVSPPWTACSRRSEIVFNNAC